MIPKIGDIARINATDNEKHGFVGKITAIEHGSLDRMATLKHQGLIAYAFLYQLIQATEEDLANPCIKVEFEESYNQGEITQMAVTNKVLGVGYASEDPQFCFDQLHAFFKSVPHYYSYRGHNHVAVHMKQPNGLPQPVRQFLIIKSEGD